MKSPGKVVLARQAVLLACLGFGQAALAQDSGSPPNRHDDNRVSAQDQRARGIARCRENRGVDCDTPAGQTEWIRQEHPITDEERQAAVAARRAREAREAQEATKRR